MQLTGDNLLWPICIFAAWRNLQIAKSQLRQGVTSLCQAPTPRRFSTLQLLHPTANVKRRRNVESSAKRAARGWEAGTRSGGKRIPPAVSIVEGVCSA